MGDVIHALPVAAALHRAWPAAEIRWLIHPAFRELIEGHPGLGLPILFPREKFRGIAGWMRSLFWSRTLRSWKPDLVLDLQGLLRSALMARCSGATRVVGLSDAREGASFFYDATAKVNKNDHAVTRYLAVFDLLDSFRNSTDAANCGVAPVLAPSSTSCTLSCCAPSTPGTSSASANLERSLSGIPVEAPEFILPQGKLPEDISFTQPFVVLHSYARGAGKNLTQEQVTAFATALETVPVVLVGRGERMSNLPSNVMDWSGRTTLLELIGILRHASFIVSSDSGPMHLAVALQPSKTLAIHRWSDPLRVGPWAQESLVWKNGKIVRVNELTEEFRAPGKTPALDEMREIGLQVLLQLDMIKSS